MHKLDLEKVNKQQQRNLIKRRSRIIKKAKTIIIKKFRVAKESLGGHT